MNDEGFRQSQESWLILRSRLRDAPQVAVFVLKSPSDRDCSLFQCLKNNEPVPLFLFVRGNGKRGDNKPVPLFGEQGDRFVVFQVFWRAKWGFGI